MSTFESSVICQDSHWVRFPAVSYLLEKSLDFSEKQEFCYSISSEDNLLVGKFTHTGVVIDVDMSEQVEVDSGRKLGSLERMDTGTNA